MKLDFFPKFTSLLAGAVVSVILLINGSDTTYSLGVLLGTLLLFYLLGVIGKKIIQKALDGNMFVRRRSAQRLGNIELQEPPEEGMAMGEAADIGGK